MDRSDVSSGLLSPSDVQEVDSIPESVPFSNTKILTEDIVSNFSIDEEKIARYESSKEWEAWTRNKMRVLVFAGYFLFVSASIILNRYSLLTEQNEEIVIIVIIGVFGISIMGMWISKKIFQNRANALGVSYTGAVYHECSHAIENYNDEKYEYCVGHLEKLQELLEHSDEEESPFNSKMERDLKEYTKKLNEGESTDFLRDTFPAIADTMLRYLVIVQYSDFDRLYSNGQKIERKSEITWHDHFRTYFGWLINSQYARRLGPYLLIIPVIIILYIVNPILAQVFAPISVGLIEGYHSIRNDE